MTDKEKMLIEENMKAIEIRTKLLVKKYGIPQDEYEEYLQIACLVICNKIHKYDETKSFSTFVDAILENSFIDMHRADKSRKIDLISFDECCIDDGCGSEASLADFLATDNNTENEVLAGITNDIIKRCIKKAKEKCTSQTTVKGFDALELKFEGYSGAEIARMFNVPSNSLRSWISRAKKTLLAEREFADLLNAL